MGFSSEIGGNFLTEKSNGNPLAEWKGERDNVCFFSSGRAAILAMILQTHAQGKKVALPYFTCHSVIEPFKRMGCEVVYYAVSADFILNIESLILFCNKEQPKLFFFHDYFGMTQEHEWKQLFDNFRNDIIFVNDQTHSFFSASSATISHYKLMSVRKWGSVSEGGTLTSLEGGKANVIYSNRTDTDQRRFFYEQASLLKSAYLAGDETVDKELFRKLFYQSEGFFDNEKEVYPMLHASYLEWEELLRSDFREKRKNNFKILSENWSESWNDWGEPAMVFNTSITPLYFPILLKSDRDHFQLFLAQQKVYAPIIWPKSEWIQCEGDDTLYNRLICIPIDQRYNESDMSYIMTLLGSYKTI